MTKETEVVQTNAGVFSPADRALKWVKDRLLAGSTLSIVAASIGWVSDWSFRSFLGLSDHLPVPGKDYFSATGDVVVDIVEAGMPFWVLAIGMVLVWLTPTGRRRIQGLVRVLPTETLRHRAVAVAGLLFALKLMFLDVPFIIPHQILHNPISVDKTFSTVPVLSSVQSAAWKTLVCAHFPEVQDPDGQPADYQRNYAVCAGSGKVSEAVLRGAYLLDAAMTVLIICLLFLPGFRPDQGSGVESADTLLRLLIVSLAVASFVAQGARTIRTFNLPLGMSTLPGNHIVINLLEREGKIWLYDQTDHELSALEGNAPSEFVPEKPAHKEDVIRRHLRTRFLNY